MPTAAHQYPWIVVLAFTLVLATEAEHAVAQHSPTLETRTTPLSAAEIEVIAEKCSLSTPQLRQFLRVYETYLEQANASRAQAINAVENMVLPADTTLQASVIARDMSRAGKEALQRMRNLDGLLFDELERMLSDEQLAAVEQVRLRRRRDLARDRIDAFAQVTGAYLTDLSDVALQIDWPHDHREMIDALLLNYERSLTPLFELLQTLAMELLPDAFTDQLAREGDRNMNEVDGLDLMIRMWELADRQLQAATRIDNLNLSTMGKISALIDDPILAAEWTVRVGAALFVGLDAQRDVILGLARVADLPSIPDEARHATLDALTMLHSEFDSHVRGAQALLTRAPIDFLMARTAEEVELRRTLYATFRHKLAETDELLAGMVPDDRLAEIREAVPMMVPRRVLTAQSSLQSEHITWHRFVSILTSLGIAETAHTEPRDIYATYSAAVEALASGDCASLTDACAEQLLSHERDLFAQATNQFAPRPSLVECVIDLRRRELLAAQHSIEPAPRIDLIGLMIELEIRLDQLGEAMDALNNFARQRAELLRALAAMPAGERPVSLEERQIAELNTQTLDELQAVLDDHVHRRLWTAYWTRAQPRIMNDPQAQFTAFDALAEQTLNSETRIALIELRMEYTERYNDLTAAMIELVRDQFNWIMTLPKRESHPRAQPGLDYTDRGRYAELYMQRWELNARTRIAIRSLVTAL